MRVNRNLHRQRHLPAHLCFWVCTPASETFTALRDSNHHPGIPGVASVPPYPEGILKGRNSLAGGALCVLASWPRCPPRLHGGQHCAEHSRACKVAGVVDQAGGEARALLGEAPSTEGGLSRAQELGPHQKGQGAGDVSLIAGLQSSSHPRAYWSALVLAVPRSLPPRSAV